jgi:hypothetical protein
LTSVDTKDKQFFSHTFLALALALSLTLALALALVSKEGLREQAPLSLPVQLESRERG